MSNTMGEIKLNSVVTHPMLGTSRGIELVDRRQIRHFTEAAEGVAARVALSMAQNWKLKLGKAVQLGISLVAEAEAGTAQRKRSS